MRWDSPKILVLDEEVSPEFNATYGKNHEASVLHTERWQYMFCFSYQWLGGSTHVVALDDFPLYRKDPFNDIEVIKALHALISEADLVVCHNQRFDVAFFRQRAIFHGLPPVRPFRTFCTLKWAQNNLKLNSNSLKNVAVYFGVTHKMETSKNLWQDIHYFRSVKAWKEMKLYNKIDTIVCAQIYQKIRGWLGVASKPHYKAMCQECGSVDVQFRGMSKQKRPKQQFQCKNCFNWGSV